MLVYHQLLMLKHYQDYHRLVQMKGLRAAQFDKQLISFLNQI